MPATPLLSGAPSALLPRKGSDKGLVARFLQRSKRNLASAAENSGNMGQGQKRRGGVEGNGTGHLPLEQVLRNSWGASQGSHPPHPHHRGHHHSHSDSRHNRRHSNQPPVTEGIHLRSCGDLSSSSSASLWRLLTANPPRVIGGTVHRVSPVRGGGTVHRVSPVRGGGGRKDGMGRKRRGGRKCTHTEESGGMVWSNEEEIQREEEKWRMVG
ncbi:protein bunched, class 2/F/G isoform-like [Oncorhynchus tshawytscha]|uniref:protein bunched, class 2/F/G isoform-like n=1 Tax=Oncorhynchus tshawytscha TaxID=74940 RepID=UPI001C3DF29F|nr:protein bunched, class 2/F/G isoform-like [Oncorhynchus tshawytscha]